MPFISGIGPFEVVIILVIALIVVGPGRLPDVGSALGKSIREFRKAATDVKEATSLEPVKADPAPTAPASAAPTSGSAPVVADVSTAPPPLAPPPAPVAGTLTGDPAPADGDPDLDPLAASALDVSELPEPLPVKDEQRTPSA